MKKLKILFAKLHLALSAAMARRSKKIMNRTIHNTRSSTYEISDRFEEFISKCKSQEKATVTLKRLTSSNTAFPILNTDLGIEHYFILPDLADRITRLQAETAITRHRYGDWGNVSSDEWRQNNSAVSDPYAVITSKYHLTDSEFFIVRTDRKKRITELFSESVLNEHKC